MGKIAFVFPGQGSQAVGMNQPWQTCGGTVADAFAEADQAVGFALTQQMNDGPESLLTQTSTTQPALVTTALAACRLIATQTDLKPDYVAGHSLGEYAAIAAAGGMTLTTAVQLAHQRGLAMQKAVPVGEGAMAAILNLDPERVVTVCQQAAQETQSVCVPANFNSPAQVVISGTTRAVERAMTLAKEQGAKRCVLLAVSAPFHSPLMQAAATAMAPLLAAASIQDPTIPVIANVTAEPVTTADQIRPLLLAQITAPVQWEASIRRLIALGVDTFVEVGTGKILTGVIKRIDPAVRALAVNGPQDLAALPPSRLAS